jgi:hypothetical protein
MISSRYSFNIIILIGVNYYFFIFIIIKLLNYLFIKKIKLASWGD